MLVSNRVIAQIRSPARVRTSSPIACRIRGLRVADVDAEGGLAVGPRRDQPGPLEPDGRRGQEPVRQVAALVFQRNGRHGQPDVLGQEADDAVDVLGLEGPGEPLDQLPLGGGARRRGLLALRLTGGAGAAAWRGPA